MTDAAWFEACKTKLDASQWEPCPQQDLMADRNDSPTVGLYEEAVYFHDFVRSFLYSQDTTSQQTYKRPHLKQMSFWIMEGETERRFDFDVGFTSLHLYKVGVAIMTVELIHKGEPLNLAETQTLTDRLRRAYPPFWFGPGAPGLSPHAAQLSEPIRKDGPALERLKRLTRLRYRDTAQDALKTGNFREPLFSWWRDLISLPVEGNGIDDEPALLRQVLDERIPVMTTISVTGENGPNRYINAISDGDWFRIAAADEAGTDPYPYDPAFLEKQRNALFYDRFAPGPETDPEGATRFMFAGYHFAAVGAGWFFDNFIVEHTRRHYRHMQHICLLEFAMLLRISQELCEAVRCRDKAQQQEDMCKAQNGPASATFRENVRAIQKTFMDFIRKAGWSG